MRNKILFVVVSLALLPLLSACLGAGPWSVTDADYTGLLAYTEERDNGTHVLWPQISVDANFCMASISGNRADSWRAAQIGRYYQLNVNVHYESINRGDNDGFNVLNGGGCDAEATGVQTYRALEVTIVDRDYDPSKHIWPPARVPMPQ